MKKKSVFTILAALIVASVIASTIAISGTTYTWEKTFEVSKPTIECEIEVSDQRVIGCPVKVWIFLKLNSECGEHCWRECKERCEDECYDLKDFECRERWGCCNIAGTYSAHLYWWNETLDDWQHVIHFQEETNVTIGCWKHVETYVFVPEWEGEYKVEVILTVDSETYSFTSES